jgi:hypothetical protein
MRTPILMSALLLSACGQSEQNITYKDSEGNDRGISVKDSGDTRTVATDDGLITATGSQGSAKARFPAFAPQYPGAKVQSVVDMNAGTVGTGGVKQHTITMLTQDTPDTVIAFYKGKISANGKPVQEMGDATSPMLIVGGPDVMKAEGYITAMPVGSGGTSVNVVVQEKQSAH